MKDFKVNPARISAFLTFISGSFLLFETISCSPGKQPGETDTLTSVSSLFEEEHVWTAPDIKSIPTGEDGKLISYGRELLVHTSKYFGPHGSISKNTNGMSCQNCHLDAGTRPYGNNLGAVDATYPRVSPRSGTTITIADKVNECMTRSMNGSPIDTTSKEMQAYVAYIKWLGQGVKKGVTPAGSGGIKAPHFISRAADPEKGKLVFETQCARCHGKDGQGQLVTDVLKDSAKQQGGNATKDDLYYYPPLWGPHSFNGVATLYRVSKFAGFVQNNMPWPMNYINKVLTDEQAWDVAAYVNTQDRLFRDHSKDYAGDISKKPYDFPFGPYADGFSEEQHKFGPYNDMPSAQQKHK